MNLKTGNKKYLALAVLSATLLAATNLTFEDVVKTLEEKGILEMKTHSTLEKVEKDELANILKSAKIMFQIQLSVDSTNPTGSATRDAHSKGHGCAIADFEIAENIPTQYRTGLFSHPGRNYESIIRYSNGSGRRAQDIVPDGRGMAVKVLNANRGNILDDGKTQDFMMINFDRFFIGSISDYAIFQELVLKERDKAAASFFAYRAIRQSLAEAGRTNAEEVAKENIFNVVANLSLLGTDVPAFIQILNEQLPGENTNILLGILSQKLIALKTPPTSLTAELYKNLPLETQIVYGISRPIQSSLTESYFSMSNYLFKVKRTNLPAVDTAVKYISRPVSCIDGTLIKPQTPSLEGQSDNYLQEDLTQRLANADQCYNFYIQALPEGLSTSEKQKLVEDPRLQFKGSPEILVARIKMKAKNNQDITSPEQVKACENLSFNPWHAGQEHRPLGALNRGRKVAVTASSIRRHFFNKKASKEPNTIKEYLRSF